MQISSVTQSPQEICFGKMIVKKGSFEALKQMENFPPKDDPKYKESIMYFYKKLMVLKKRCETNLSYNVVLKPEQNTYTKGKIILEDNDGVEMTAFQESFRQLCEYFGFKPKKMLTKKEEPRLLSRYFKNRKIAKENMRKENEPRNYNLFFDTIIRRIERYVIDAESLDERRKLKDKILK